MFIFTTDWAKYYIEKMKRKYAITDNIHRAYDGLKELGCFRNDGGTLAIVPGVFIDPGIGSAKVQKIDSFVYGYEGNSDNRIISVSDIYCQKIWVVCYFSAKLIVEGGLFAYTDKGQVYCTCNYLLSDESKTKVFLECAEFLKEKKEHLAKGIEDISDKLIKVLSRFNEPDRKNANLNYDVADWISTYAIKMLMLHEYSHIQKQDPESAPFDVHIANEKRADIDAYSELSQKDPSLLSNLGALCLQSSSLFLNARIEGFDHPDVDERIEYIYNYFPKEGVEGDIYRDVLDLFVHLWARLNDREDAYLKIGQVCTPDSLFGFLKKEKARQN